MSGRDPGGENAGAGGMEARDMELQGMELQDAEHRELEAREVSALILGLGNIHRGDDAVGREVARLEIRIVLREILRRTKNLRIDGEAPFIASMFAHTLVQLPISFDPQERSAAPVSPPANRREAVG